MMKAHSHLPLLLFLITFPYELNGFKFTIPRPTIGLKSKVKAKFTELFTRVEELEARANQSEQGSLRSVQAIPALNSRMTKIDTRMNTLDTKTDSLKRDVSNTNMKQVEKLQKEVTSDSMARKRLDSGTEIRLRNLEAAVLKIPGISNLATTADRKVNRALATQGALSVRLGQVEKRLAEIKSSGGGDSSCPEDRGYRLLTSARLCLKYYMESMNFDTSRARCEKEKRGRIIKLDTTFKIQSVVAYHKSKYAGKNYFVGMVRYPRASQRPFHWTDGSDVTVHKWGAGQPDNNRLDDCAVATTGSNYRWLDVYCTDRQPITICEIVQ